MLKGFYFFLKQKLYGGNCETCPIRDIKFKKLVEEFIDKKEKIIAMNTKKDEYDEEDSASYDYENFDNHNKDEEDIRMHLPAFGMSFLLCLM